MAPGSNHNAAVTLRMDSNLVIICGSMTQQLQTLIVSRLFEEGFQRRIMGLNRLNLFFDNWSIRSKKGHHQNLQILAKRSVSNLKENPMLY